jgi:hypothetical protein
MAKTSLRRSRAPRALALSLATTSLLTLVTGLDANAAARQPTDQVNTGLRKACNAYSRVEFPALESTSVTKLLTAYDTALLAHNRVLAGVNPADAAERAAVIGLRGAVSALDKEVKVIVRLTRAAGTKAEGFARAAELAVTFQPRFDAATKSLQEVGLFVCTDLLDAGSTGIGTTPAPPAATTPPTAPPTTAPPAPTTTAASLQIVKVLDETLNPLFVAPAGKVIQRNPELDAATDAYIRENSEFLLSGMQKAVYNEDNGRFFAAIGIYRWKTTNALLQTKYNLDSVTEYDAKKLADINGFAVYLGKYRTFEIIYATRGDVNMEIYSEQSLNQQVVRDLAELVLRKAPAKI